MNYIALLNDIEKTISSWGDKLEPPITQEELVRFKERVKYSYKLNLPDCYINFIKKTNGFEFNGLIIFGSMNSEANDASLLDLIESNVFLRDSTIHLPDQTLVIGESSTGVLTFDGINNVYQYRDRIALVRVESYLSFDDMMTKELNKVI
ncbi:SMI1/KNR4 family protein [Catenovulum sp. SM1970]|uniref:YrhA family protein n=1 Tax=Marinifaba aquimaris TaxID=2741323 RepID=UPI0015728E1D|nr:YrhA family protein [Marinifaba aquimaris]NTS77878.1 SMI1/KNR4 family protein [Marinifaba aquimaris]